jgi:phage/plasmid-like protein (TIGR03299 family)
MTNSNSINTNSTMNNSIHTSELTLENFERTMNLLESTGLNWEVKKEPFIHPSGLNTDYYGIFRYNPGDDTPVNCLGAVKERYTPFQNWALADTIVRATEGLGIQTNRGGQLNGGRKVYLQSQLPDEYVGKSGVKRWITCVNSHDGSASISFGSTNTVIVCQNTFYRAYRESDKFRHTITAQQRINIAIEQFQNTMNADKALFDSFKKMSELVPNDNLVQAVLNRMFKVDSANLSADEISTRKMNQMKQFAAAYSTERELEGDTVWGLFNAVTRYTNHMSSPTDSERKNDYLMSGSGYQINNAAYETIMAWVEANTVTKSFITVG